MTKFDWPALLRAARGLGLRPAEFWCLTPAEFGHLLGHGEGAPPLTRKRLEDLARAFPDKERNGPSEDSHG